MSKKVGYYSDGVTRFTDPFYRCLCRGCLQQFWSVTIGVRCTKCQSEDVFYSFHPEETQAEFIRLKEGSSEESRNNPIKSK